MPQVLIMASVIAKLQTTLDVYEGLFVEIEDAEVTIKSFSEIGNSLKASLSTHIIIGCAAIFSDPEKSCGNENMSLKNIISKYEDKLSENTQKLKKVIFGLVTEMNLKTFRNKHVGHFGLEECLGYKKVERDITVDKVRLLLKKSQIFINMLIKDAELMPEGHSLAYYSEIPASRSTKKYLMRLSQGA
jgi:hypothetical protein